MKEKTIEKIPYLGLKKISRIKSVKYIGVTAIKNIGHQRHLLLEVYENKKESKKIPVVRITLTKKDFGTYWPDKQIWTRQQLSAYSPIWTETHTYTAKSLADENILQSPEDLARIKSFCGTEIYNDTRWWGHIAEYEGDITSKERTKRVERKYKRRQEALKDRQANTKELPEKAILYRADHVYFRDEHFLYYKKHGSWADIACSKCGGVTTARWKSSGAYEDQFERNIEEPRENSFGTCPMCGAHGQYKCKGRVKGSIRKTRYLFLGQKYKDNGFVMRYIQVEKEWTLGFIAGENDNEMYNAYEKLSGVELARAYFEPGKKVQVDYNKHDPYVGRDFWDDCNLYGLSSIRINSGPILPETYGEMAGTMFQYSAMKEYTDSLMSVCNPVEYLECYMRTPQLEMLVKMHLTGVAEKLIKCQYGIIEDENATRPDEFLGIRKEKLKLLIKEKGDIGLLRVLQMEKRLAENWTDEQVAATAATVPATAEYRKIMGSLEVSSQNAGYTAEQTAESYRTLYGVLADDQTAATTTANLQALGLSQEELSTVIEGTIGAWATYGDSIPIDGLAESINETVKTSTVTGTFADMLNWAGTSEDAFNEKLAACGSESERVNLVMQEMANQGLVDAGKKWQENNKNLVDGNKATADFQQATAELADTVAPLITKITELVAGLIEEFNQLSPEGQRVIAGCVLVVAAVGPVFSIISKVSGGVSSLIGIISKIAPVLGPIKTGFAAVNAVMAANPILIIIAAVAALIAIFVTLYNKCEWFRDGVNDIFGAVANFIKGAIDKIKGFFDFDWKLPKIKLPHFKASGEWSLSPLKVPKISVDWYANGGILNSPTIFGANGDSLMGGGEAGKEAVLPIKLLKDYIREENDANNATLAAMIVEAFKSISMTAENNIYIGDKKSITLLTNLVLKQMANKTLATQGAKGK